MEDDLKKIKKMEDDLQKNGRRPKKKYKKIEDDLKKRGKQSLKKKGSRPKKQTFLDSS